MDTQRKVLRFPDNIVKKLIKAHYGVWNHSTVELCHWTKKSLKNEGDCYKKKFYGIDTHRCVEFSPAGMICNMKCIFCWRPTEFMKRIYMNEDEVDDPKTLMDGILRERRRLLSGYPGNPKVDMQKYKEALEPNHYAISLSGEPTLYPKLPELIKYLKSLPNTRSIFLVTNGVVPSMLERLMREDALPTQLYISMNAPNESLFIKINRPLIPNAWDLWLKSLKLLSGMNTRTVIRFTLIKGLNTDEEYIPEYAKLIRVGNPHFVEIKSYMHVGYSTRRLKKENMLYHEEVIEYANKLLQYLPNFKYMDDHPPSRIVVLQNMDRYINRWIP